MFKSRLGMGKTKRASRPNAIYFQPFIKRRNLTLSFIRDKTVMRKVLASAVFMRMKLDGELKGWIRRGAQWEVELFHLNAFVSCLFSKCGAGVY